MQLGMVGLGVMGTALSIRALAAGHEVHGYDVVPAAKADAEKIGVQPAAGLAALMAGLRAPRTVWIMLKAGPLIDDVLQELSLHLEPGDVVVDGGDSDYRDSIRRATTLKQRGVNLIDVAISGGRWGTTEGYSVTSGGDADAARRLEPLFRAIAIEGGYLYAGESGAGHYSKLVLAGAMHMMIRAYAEAFDLLEAEPRVTTPSSDFARAWSHGGVIQSLMLSRYVQSCEHGIVKALEDVPFEALRSRLRVTGRRATDCAEESLTRHLADPGLLASALAQASYAGDTALCNSSRFQLGYLINNGGIRRDEFLDQHALRAAYQSINPPVI